MSYSKQILVGVAAGVAVGLFLGDLAGSLKVAADAYLKLLQMTVLPYVVVSIIIGLGSLSLAQAKTLALRGGAVLLLLWALALAVVFVFPLMLPPQQTASFFSTTLLAPHEPFDFVGLYIPSNPFNALANNVVPAVVLFSAFLGVSLIAVPDKQPLLDVFAVAEKAMARVMKLVARLMPLGLFFITATAAGTLSVEELRRLQVYLLSYIAVSLLLSLWVLPGLVSALTPIPYRAVLGRTRDALLTAFLTGSLFIVLPMLIDATKALLREYRPDNPEVESLPNVIVATSFNFPHAGKLLALTFILFAGWFSDVVVPGREYPKLAATGLLVLFGNINVAVPFLLDLFGIPADTFHLFNVTSVVNARFGTLVAGSHTIAVALLGTWALAGGWHVDARRVGRYVAITALLGVFTIVGMQTLLARTVSNEYDRDKVIAKMQLLTTRDRAVEYRRSADVPADTNTAPAPRSDSPARGRAGGLPAGQPALRLRERRRPAGGFRRRNGARARRRARRQAGARARRTRAARRAPRERLLRHRDVGAGGHPGARGGAAVVDGVSRRNARLRRPRRGARSLCHVGRDQGHAAVVHPCAAGPVLREEAAGGAPHTRS